eukprot:Em0010g602a
MFQGFHFSCDTGSSSSSSSESSDSDARKKKQKSKSSGTRGTITPGPGHSFSNAPFIMMVPTPSKREVKKIKRGKYAHFDKLLSPIDDPSSLPAGKRKGKDRCQVSDLGSWLEAWNIFIAIRVQIAPPHCTGAGEVPVNCLTAFSVYSVAATLKCSGKLQPETGPPLECTEGGLAGMVRHEPCILDQTAILHQLTDWNIRGTSTPRSHNWQLSPGAPPHIWPGSSSKKKKGKWRVILHLSAPEGLSINDFIAKEEFAIHYSTIVGAVALLSRFNKGARMAKSLLGPEHLQQLCQRTSMGLGEQLRRKRSARTSDLYHLPGHCSRLLTAAAPVPPDRPQEISSPMMSWLGKRTATKRELLSLIGKLFFAAKVVPAGRLFLRHLIHLSTSVRRLHHHIHLNPEARADLQCWNSFLPSWNGISMFIVPEWKDAESFQLYTDASTSFGFGAYLDGAWFRGDWRPHQQLPKCSIQWQELFAIISAACTWGHLQAGQYISQALQANTIQVYLAAVTHLYLTHGFSSPAHNNPTLNLAIRGMQRSQGPAHLKPKRLPLTVEMLEQLLRLLDSDPLSRHDRLMLKAALTFGFFGFLRVSEYTRNTSGRFEPRIHPTRNDVSWVKEGIHFLIKKTKTDQTGRGTIISMSYTHRTSCPVMALQADFGNCTAQPRVVLFHFHTGRPLISRVIRAILKDLLLRCGYDTSKYNTHSLRIGAATAAAQAGLPLSTIQRLGRWSSTAYTTYTRIH